MRIHRVVSKKKNLSGLLLYIVHDEEEHNRKLRNTGKDLALGVVLYASALEEEVVHYQNPEQLQQKYISKWHKDFETVIEQLKSIYSSQRINYMIDIIEDFIKTTIKLKYDNPGLLR